MRSYCPATEVELTGNDMRKHSEVTAKFSGIGDIDSLMFPLENLKIFTLNMFYLRLIWIFMRYDLMM